MQYSFVISLVALVVIFGGCVQPQSIPNTVTEPSTTTDIPSTVTDGGLASDWCNPGDTISFQVEGKTVSPLIEGWATFKGKSFCKGYVNNTPPGMMDGATTTYYFNENHSEIYVSIYGWPDNYLITHIVNGSAISSISNVYFEEIEIDCVNFISDKEYWINSEADFNEQVTLGNPFTDQLVIAYNGAEACKDYQFPMPDFSTKTILGKATEASGCDRVVTKNVYVDSTAKKYTYEVSILEIGMCIPLILNNNWIIVDKITDDYTVEFKVIKIPPSSETKIIPFEEFELKCVGGSPNTEYVINSEAEFNDQILKNIPNPNSISCDDYQIPVPDFSTKTLLGKGIDFSGCDQIITRSLVLEGSAKKYIYTVTVEEIGSCEPGGYTSNWITVDKIPSDYTVEFNVVKTKK